MPVTAAAPADSAVLFRSRVLFVSGKGGTGKTSVAAAIGRLAATQGRRTLVLELDNQRPSLTSIFGVRPKYAPVEVAKNLSIANVEWVDALGDWLEAIVNLPRVVRLIMRNHIVSVFLEATPGARDLVVLWRVMAIARSYDLVVVDMPASGNAVAMLSVAHTARRLFEQGPIRRCADDLVNLYAQPDTKMVLVALPEEMVVNETVETARRIGADLAPLRVPVVVLNRATPPSLSPAESALLAGLLAGPSDGLAREVLEAGRWEARLESATAESLERLGTELGLPVLVLPVLARGEGALRVVAQLTSAMARTSSVPIDLRGGA
ncbi:MAG: ArsA-related P-loop ATPase [Myxococcota bacterium]